MNNNSQSSQNINILNLINVFLSYWILLAVSSAIFLAVALVYLKYASKTYGVFARISLTPERNNTNQGSNAYVNVNDLMDQQKTFTNEVSFLRSSPLVKEIIKDMNLFTSYYTKADKIPKEFKFSYTNIYKSSPFLVVIDEKSPQPLNVMFYLKIIDDQRFSIYAKSQPVVLYHYDTEEIDSQSDYVFALNGTYKFGETIRNGYCSFKVLLNSNYNPDQYQSRDLFFKFNNPQKLALDFQKSLTVGTAFYESSIIDLSFEWDNLDLAGDFLQQLINKYIQKNLERKNYNANNTIKYIDEQLESFSGSLGKSEIQLQNFQASRDVLNITEKATTLNSQLRLLEQSRDEIQLRYQYLSNLNNYLEANKDMSSIIAPPLSGMSDATLATLIQELTTLSTERQNLVSTNQLKNARLKTLDANIETIKKVISDNIVFSMSAAQNELEAADKRIAELSREIYGMPQTQRQLQGLEREFNLNNAVYTTLMDRRIQAQIIMASNRPDCEIIEPVRYVEVTSPSPKKAGAIAIFLGLFFPSIYIVIVNFLSPRIRTKEELVRFCKLPGMGYIPHNDKQLANVILNYPTSPIAERFRSLRSNIIYHFAGETKKAILMTSTLPGEGKSFVSMNLAMSFASTQKKTILVCFDLRKSSKILEEFIPKDFKAGISSYLIREAEVSDIIINTSVQNLDILPSGPIPPDPVSLISQSRTEALFSYLKERYDYVIIDTPPFGLVTDAFVLMQYSNLSLYITRLGIIMKSALKHSMEEISNREIRNVYMVQNDTTTIDKDYVKNYSYEEPLKKKFRLFRKKG